MAPAPAARATVRVPPPVAGGAHAPISAARPTSSTAGVFFGYVNDSTDRHGIGNVTVTESSPTYCGSLCGGARTAGTGAFSMSCNDSGGLGSDYTILASPDAWWLSNLTYAACVAGTSVDLGTLFLVRDGVAKGRVLDGATGLPVANVSVSSVSRDGLIAGVPNITGADGSFLIGVPPEPSRIDVTPGYGYLPTFNYTNATPGSGTRPGVPPWTNPVDLGTFYLSRETLVTVALVDSATGLPLSASDLSAIQPCDGATGSCQGQGAATYGGRPSALTPPGPIYLRVDAIGYVDAVTSPRTVPPEGPGVPFSFGTVALTPLGSVPLEIDLARPTGGAYPWGAPPATVESVVATVCNLDGYQQTYLTIGGNISSSTCMRNCVTPGTTSVLVPPLRDSISIAPDTVGYCGPGPMWPEPPYAPAVGHELTVNVTAGYVLPGTVYANLTLGDYVGGDVFVAGTGTAPSTCFQVTATSTDSADTSLGGQGWDSCSDGSTEWAPCKGLGSFHSSSFCVPVPPGDARLRVQAGGYAKNYTWVRTPLYCCQLSPGYPGYPASLRAATPDRVTSINLTPLTGTVTGWTISGATGSGPGPSVYAVSVCSAFDPTATCGGGTGTSSGFSVTDAPAGVDAVLVTARGFASNEVWVNVTAGANVSAGTIPLLPDGTVAGRVVDASGAGLYAVNIQYCRLASAGSCYQDSGQLLGLGYTSTDGRFNGTLPGGWLPEATYVLVAFAAGYTDNWEFVNVTSGGFATLPPLALTPLGGASARPARALPAAPAAGVWVTGRIIDSVTGSAIDSGTASSVSVCPLAGGLCGGIPDGLNSEGFFNCSVAPGLYDLNVSAPGYASKSIFLNATGRRAVDLGDIVLSADWWVAGRVAMNPWPSITLSHGGTFGSGYGPATDVVGCDATGSHCQLGLSAAQNGTFNVTVPPGTGATILVRPFAGMLGNQTTLVIGGPFTTITAGPLLLDLFGPVGGRILDGNSANATNQSGHPLLGLSNALGQAYENGTQVAVVGSTTDADGYWVVLVPPGSGARHTRVVGREDPGYLGAWADAPAAVRPGYGGDVATALTLYHVGWIVARFTATGTGVPVSDALVSVAGYDPVLKANVSTGDFTNGAGWTNVTAVPGLSDRLTISAALYNGSAVSIPEVVAESTTFVNGSAYATIHPIRVPSMASVRSPYVGFSSGPPPVPPWPSPAVTDASNGLGIPGASVSVSSSDPNVGPGALAVTNEAGQFYTDGPPGARDTIFADAPAYEPSLLTHRLAPGQLLRLASINLTGDAVVAGRAVSRENGTPVIGATVTLCAPSNATLIPCQTATTNASGDFWGTVAPGVDTITIGAAGFVSNSSSIRTCSDCWASIGTVRLAPEGGIDGVVRAIPSGFLASDVNVSLCPAGLYQGVPCGLTSITGNDGSFFLQVPPGDYELTAVGPGYNATIFPIAIALGQFAHLGTLFVESFGSADGRVVNGSGLPVANATVYPCEDWGSGACAPSVTTDDLGFYWMSAAPGPYVVSAYAEGYQVANTTGRIVAGGWSWFPAIRVYPIGDNTPLDLSGRVVSSSDPQRGLPGVTVAAMVRGSVAYSTVTDPTGAFDLAVGYGTYRLVASLDGYGAVATTVIANRTITGLRFALAPMTYEVSGYVVDGLTGQPVAGVLLRIATGTGPGGTGPTLATSGPDGSYAFSAPNGSIAIAVVPPSDSPVAYAPVDLTISVNARAVQENLTLAPGRGTLRVVVEDAGSGLPIPGASVVLDGDPETGFLYHAAFTAGPDGRLSVALYFGAYRVLGSAGGYLAHQVVHALTNSTDTLVLSLRAEGTGPSGSSVLSIGWTPALTVGVLVAAALAAVLIVRRRGRPRYPPVTLAPLVEGEPYGADTTGLYER